MHSRNSEEDTGQYVKEKKETKKGTPWSMVIVGSKYRCNKCSFGIVPPQAMRKGQRKVCKLCLELADI